MDVCKGVDAVSPHMALRRACFTVSGGRLPESDAAISHLDTRCTSAIESMLRSDDSVDGRWAAIRRLAGGMRDYKERVPWEACLPMMTFLDGAGDSHAMIVWIPIYLIAGFRTYPLMRGRA